MTHPRTASPASPDERTPMIPAQNAPFQPSPRPDDPEIDLAEYLRILRRRLRAFVLAALAVFTSAAVYTFTATPIYEATATLHVKDEKTKTGILGQLALSEVSPVDSEIEIIKARTNAETVVRQLHLDWRIEKRSEGLSFEIADFTSADEGRVVRYHIVLTGADSYSITDSDGKEIGTGKTGELLSHPQMTLRITDLVGKKGDRSTLALQPFNQAVRELRNAVRVSEVGRKTNIIEIGYRNADPVLAREVVQALVQAYLDKTVSLKSEEASRTVSFLGEQLKGVRSDLDRAEAELQGYKSTAGIVQLDAEALRLIQTVSDLERQRAELLLRMKQAEFSISSLHGATLKGAIFSPAVLVDDPVMAGLAGKLADMQVQRNALLADNSPDHPVVKALQGQIEELQRTIRSTYESSLKGLQEQEAEIARQLSAYDIDLKRLPATERDLARFTRVAKVNGDIYTFLLQKHEEARIAKASTISNIDIVDPAFVGDNPVAPQKPVNLLLGLVLGCMFGLGVVLFQEYVDDSIRDPDRAKREIGKPVLAIIPHLGTKEASREGLHHTLVSQLDPKAHATEAFRSLRTAIHFSAIDRKRQLVLVTSSFPGEGKSTITANLAVILAQAGARVLVIDCDLRRPSLHSLFRKSKAPGLTDVLAGDCAVEKAVHEVGVPGLTFLGAGTTPPSPAELLGSTEMSQLITSLRERYDTILIDAPPALAVTDAPVLAGAVDLVLLVMEAGRVPAKAARRVREMLDTVGARIAGVVMNDKSSSGDGYGYYRYYGGYSYGDQMTSGRRKRWWKR